MISRAPIAADANSGAAARGGQGTFSPSRLQLTWSVFDMNIPAAGFAIRDIMRLKAARAAANRSSGNAGYSNRPVYCYRNQNTLRFRFSPCRTQGLPEFGLQLALMRCGRRSKRGGTGAPARRGGAARAALRQAGKPAFATGATVLAVPCLTRSGTIAAGRQGGNIRSNPKPYRRGRQPTFVG